METKMSASFIHIQSGAVAAASPSETIRPYALDAPVLGGAGEAVDVRLRWYAAYTCANHEKHVEYQLRARSVEHFLPVYESMRRWKDRRVKLEMPLFPGY